MGTGKGIKFLLYLLCLMVIGTIGFYLIGGEEWSLLDSLYMTMITLSTVGFTEVHTLSEIGRIWAMLLIIFGVSGFAIMVSQIGAELINFKQYRGRRMLNKIKKMKNHYIICGYGRMGAVIARELHEKHHPFLVIDTSEEKIEKIMELGYKYIQGDATLEETLHAARVEEASGIVVVLDNDQDNLFVTMSARTLNSKAFIISRYANLDTRSKLIRAGANKVVNPYEAGGHKMAELLLNPYLEDTVSIITPKRDLELVIDEIKVSDIDQYDGIMIKDSRIREEYNLVIVGIIEADGQVTLNPDPHKILRDDQIIMVIGAKDNLEKFKANIPEKSYAV
jgi:voltage-gated potassium channel